MDDVPDVRDVFARFLHGAGMRVTQADGGRSAMAAACHAAPDLVVTDLSMPDMDGLELCRRLRTNPGTSEVPILVVSGSVPADEARSRAAGYDAVLEKPCSRAQLVAAVLALLAVHPAGA